MGFIASLVALLGGCSGSGAVPAGDAVGFVEYLDATVPELLEEHRVPGLTVALVP